jgi:hypothetical protein
VKLICNTPSSTALRHVHNILERGNVSYLHNSMLYGGWIFKFKSEIPVSLYGNSVCDVFRYNYCMLRFNSKRMGGHYRDMFLVLQRTSYSRYVKYNFNIFSRNGIFEYMRVLSLVRVFCLPVSYEKT